MILNFTLTYQLKFLGWIGDLRRYVIFMVQGDVYNVNDFSFTWYNI